MYDSLGELIKTSGTVNSSYTYDGRGNMLSKTVNGEKTTFEYANALWQDQLTKVNGKALTYDANGNLQSYDGAEYTWSHGKRLSSITNGDTKYEYQYDLNGIRSYKTVNGVTTKFDTLNGKILAQSDKNNKILFQYNGDTPIGFELNSTQYFYLNEGNNSSGSPNDKVKKKLKEKTGWDWDAKEKAYNEKQKNNNFSLDFGNVGDVIIATLLIVIVIGSGVGIAILIILALLPDPVPFPVPV